MSEIKKNKAVKYIESLLVDAILVFCIMWCLYTDIRPACALHNIAIFLIGLCGLNNTYNIGLLEGKGKTYKTVLPAWFNLTTDLAIVYALYRTGHIYMAVVYYTSSFMLNMSSKEK